MAIDSTVIDSAGTVLFTAVGDKMIATMIFCNTENPDPYNEDNNIAYLDLHLVKGGGGTGSATKTNQIVKALAIPAGETVFFDTERVVLQDSDEVIGFVQSGNAEFISCTISSVDI
jgi:hypothetical protein